MWNTKTKPFYKPLELPWQSLFSRSISLKIVYGMTAFQGYAWLLIEKSCLVILYL